MCVDASVTDQVVETNEAFTLALQSVNSTVRGYPSLFVTALANGTGTIYHEVQVSIDDAQAVEGAALAFNVWLNHSVTSPVTVNYTLVRDGTASAGDFSDSVHSLVFQSGSTQETIIVQSELDDVVEQNETFSVVLTGVSHPVAAIFSASINDGKAVGTIVDDDEVVLSLTAVTSAVFEGEDLVFEAALAKAVSTDVDVTFVLAGGSAVAEATSNVDFKDLTGMAVMNVTFRAALLEMTKLLTVESLVDSLTEGTETFTIAVSGDVRFNASWGQDGAGQVADGTEVGSIHDEDQVFLVIEDATANEGADLVFVLKNSRPADMAFNVSCVVEAGTAVNGTNDYVSTTVVAIFELHSNTTTVHVAALEDGLAEGNETFTVRILHDSLTLPSTHNISFPRDTAVGTIVDIDVDVQVNVSSAAAQEGSNLTFNVTLSVPAVENVLVEYVYTSNHADADELATPSRDYTPYSQSSVVVNAGDTLATVSVELVADGLVELTETLQIFLLSAEAVEGNKFNAHTDETRRGTGTIVNMDQTQVVMSDGASREGECTPFSVYLS